MKKPWKCPKCNTDHARKPKISMSMSAFIWRSALGVCNSCGAVLPKAEDNGIAKWNLPESI